VREVPAATDGLVRSIGAVDVGMAALRLGAGRHTKDDEIDHAVGIRCLKKRGDETAAGEPLAEIHARTDEAAEAASAEVLAAYTIGDDAPEPRAIVLETIA
jgi:thymidine phosphorylase